MFPMLQRRLFEKPATIYFLLRKISSIGELWETKYAIFALLRLSQFCSVLSSVLETLMRRCSLMRKLWTVLARKLWLRRNSVVFGGVFISPNQLMREAVISIEDFKRANVPTEKENDFQAIPVPPVQWKAPSLGLYKINWDAAIDMKNRRMGVGIIARDYQVLVVAARSLTLHGHTDSLVAEAWAALHAVVLAKESGLLDFILEGDALQVVNEINLVIPSLSKIGHFTDDIRSVLHSPRSFHVIHVKRGKFCCPCIS
jgi:hypothetical protein